MDSSLSRSSGDRPQRYLDRAEVLAATVVQIRKDLSQDNEEIPEPIVGEGAFEELRVSVLQVLRALEDRGGQALQTAMYRVDIPESHLRRTLHAGGLHALAGEVVVRALQKVLTRLRYAGRF